MSSNLLGNPELYENDATDGKERLRTTGTITGEISPSGLKTAGKNTTMDIGTTAVQLPSSPLSERNALSIHNTSTTDILYIGFDNTVTADSVVGNTSGRQVGAGQIINFDVTDAVAIWAIAATTIRVQIMELA